MTDGDLISRQAVIDGLARIAKAKAKSDAQQALMGRSMFFVENLPSVKTNGDLISKSVFDQIKWERDIAIEQLKNLGYELGEKPRAEETAELRIVGNTTMHYECSLCGGAVDKWDNYCKHCGAKMKGEAEREKAEKTAECDNSHDCEHCDWTECPLEVEKETDGDLISRKEAEKCCLDGWNKDYKDILEDIRKLPSEEKTAEWIKIREGIKVTEYKCSACGRVVCDDTDYDVVIDYPYCHCGCRMKGEEGA